MPSRPVFVFGDRLVASGIIQRSELDMPREDQRELLPEERPEGSFETVALSDIEPVAPFDVDGLPESIRRLGLLQPIVLRQERVRRSRQNPWLYSIVEGRRRVLAMRQLAAEEYETLEDATPEVQMPAFDDFVSTYNDVSAIVYPRGTPRHVAASMALSANMHRSPNVLNEFEQIQQLVRDGWPEDEIAHELRLPVNTIRARMRLGALIEPLRDRLAAGQMSPSTAVAAARLSRDLQTDIVAYAAEETRVTARHVRQAREVRDQAFAESEPAIFDMPEAVDVDGVPFPSHPTLTQRPSPAEPQRPAAVAHANGDVVRIEISLPDGQAEVPSGWEFVVAYLTAAEMAIPAAPDDDTDWIFQTLAELRERVDAAAGVASVD